MCTAVLAAGVVLLAPGTASAAGGRTVLPPNAHGLFWFGGVAAGQSETQVFTFSTARWPHWSGRLFVHLSHSASYSVSSDGCTGTLLTPSSPSCQVSVTFAPAAGSGRSLAELWVFGSRTTGWGRTNWRFFSTVLLHGHVTGTGGNPGGSGPTSLLLAPGTASGSNAFGYSFGQVGVASQAFTLTNVGGEASLPLALNGWTSDGGYALSDDTCTGTALAAGGSCTFTETWTSANDPLCDGVGEPVSLSPTIDSSDASANYADVSLSAICG